MADTLSQQFKTANQLYNLNSKKITEILVLEILNSLQNCRDAKDDDNLRRNANLLSVKICYKHREKIPANYHTYKDPQKLFEAFESLLSAQGQQWSTIDRAFIKHAMTTLESEISAAVLTDKLLVMRIKPK